MTTNSFIIEQVSPYDVATTVERIIDTAVLKEWQNPATHNLQQSLAKSGRQVRPVQVIEICKPAFSGQMLERSDERIFSIMMPCRISVYEKEDGKTYVALLDTSAMSAGMPETVMAAMKGASDESFDIVNTVINP